MPSAMSLRRFGEIDRPNSASASGLPAAAASGNMGLGLARIPESQRHAQPSDSRLVASLQRSAITAQSLVRYRAAHRAETTARKRLCRLRTSRRIDRLGLARSSRRDCALRAGRGSIRPLPKDWLISSCAAARKNTATAWHFSSRSIRP